MYNLFTILDASATLKVTPVETKNASTADKCTDSSCLGFVNDDKSSCKTMTNPRATRKCMLRRIVFEFSGHCLARQMKRCNAIARCTPLTSFNASAFVRIPDCGTFDGRGCLVDRETRESLVLSPSPPHPPPPIFTTQQALKHDSCPSITTAHNSLKKML